MSISLFQPHMKALLCSLILLCIYLNLKSCRLDPGRAGSGGSHIPLDFLASLLSSGTQC